MATAFDSPFFQELQLLFTLATWVGASPRRARRRPAKATRKPGQCPKLKYSSWNRENNSSKNTLHLCYDFTAALNTRQADPTVQWFLIMEKGLKMSLFVPSVFSRLRHEKKKKKKSSSISHLSRLYLFINQSYYWLCYQLSHLFPRLLYASHSSQVATLIYLEVV